MVPVAADRSPGLRRLPPLPVIDGAALGIAEVEGPLGIIVYVGTPGIQRKAVCTLVDERGEPVAILKVPLEAGAHASLARETANLIRLEAERPDLPVPRALRLSAGSSVHGQTILPGRPSGRSFGSRHAEFLGALGGSGSVDLASVAAALRDDPVASRLAPSVRSWLGVLGGRVPAVWVHGDFAPWNLRVDKGRRLAAFDWEEGRADGLPVWDIAHFHVQQAFLFGESQAPLARMEANPAYDVYLGDIGLTREQGRSLFWLYCIDGAGQAIADGQDALAQFLLGQLTAESSIS